MKKNLAHPYQHLWVKLDNALKMFFPSILMSSQLPSLTLCVTLWLVASAVAAATSTAVTRDTFSSLHLSPNLILLCSGCSVHIGWEICGLGLAPDALILSLSPLALGSLRNGISPRTPMILSWSRKTIFPRLPNKKDKETKRKWEREAGFLLWFGLELQAEECKNLNVHFMCRVILWVAEVCSLSQGILKLGARIRVLHHTEISGSKVPNSVLDFGPSCHLKYLHSQSGWAVVPSQVLRVTRVVYWPSSTVLADMMLTWILPPGRHVQITFSILSASDG